jgi:hypothetical protein
MRAHREMKRGSEKLLTMRRKQPQASRRELPAWDPASNN